VSIEMLFGMAGVLFALLALFEAGAYWHTRTILDDAASDGARVAAAYDGTCTGGIDVARAALSRQAGSWADAVDITCAAAVAILILRRPLPQSPPKAPGHSSTATSQWLPPLLPLLAITLLATALPALMQSALPLDLVRGGLQRPAIKEGMGALLIGLQLSLLVLIQWPVGQALAKRPVAYGLGVSLVSFALGTALLAFSAITSQGIWLVMAAQLPIALGEAAFLPIATEAVIELTPPEHQGLAMALFSQCFAISALIAPVLAGLALDQQRHGGGFWITMTLLCLAGFNAVKRLKSKPAGA
jgi:predicted MFS family arabinose efflux permease